MPLSIQELAKQRQQERLQERQQKEKEKAEIIRINNDAVEEEKMKELDEMSGDLYESDGGRKTNKRRTIKRRTNKRRTIKRKINKRKTNKRKQ
jgi:hypothetical protein